MVHIHRQPGNQVLIAAGRTRNPLEVTYTTVEEQMDWVRMCLCTGGTLGAADGSALVSRLCHWSRHSTLFASVALLYRTVCSRHF